MKTKPDKEILEAMRKNPDNCKGVFYINRKDPGLIVPKYYSSMGWTFNFGSPYAYIFVITVVLILL